MPAKQAASSLFSKIGKRLMEAHAKVKDDPVKYDTGERLPPGINNGIARLTKCYFGEFKDGNNKGEPFFMAEGVVLEPKDHDGIPIEGQHTRIGPEPLCDTPNSQGKRKTFLDHWAWILNELKKLAGDDYIFDPKNPEGSVAAIEQAAPVFRFRTWQGQATAQFPNPRVQETWNGMVPNYEVGDVDDVVDQTTDEPATAATADAEPSENGDGDLSDDIDVLAESADNQHVPSQEKLDGIARAAGIDPDSSQYKTWADVAAALKEAEAEAEPEEAEPEPEEEWKPVKGKVYKYKFPKARKAVDVEVTKVEATTVVVKNLDDGKAYKGIPWAKLEH